MKKNLTITGFLLITVALIAITPVGAAGTGNFDPNTFNCFGQLLVRANGDQAPGTPMELWTGLGNETAGRYVGRIIFHTDVTVAPPQDYVRIELVDSVGNPVSRMFPFDPIPVHIHFAPNVDEVPRTKQGYALPGEFKYNFHVSLSSTFWEFPVKFDAVGAIQVEGLVAVPYTSDGGPAWGDGKNGAQFPGMPGTDPPVPAIQPGTWFKFDRTGCTPKQ